MLNINHIFRPFFINEWTNTANLTGGIAYDGRTADAAVTSSGDRYTGIERVKSSVISRGVLLDAGRAFGSGPTNDLPDGFAITEAHLEEIIRKQGPTSRVKRGDIVLVRTGQMERCLRNGGWNTAPNNYTGGPAPGLSFSSLEVNGISACPVSLLYS